MTFKEYPLYDAICTVFKEMEEKGLHPRGINYFIYEKDRAWLAGQIHSKLSKEDKKKFPVDEEQYLKLWDNFGKSANPNSAKSDTKSSTKLLVEIARLHGPQCAFCQRDGKECSETMTVDRIKPGERGGKYDLANCQIACSRHNTSRGTKSIEDSIKHSTEPQQIQEDSSKE